MVPQKLVENNISCFTPEHLRGEVPLLIPETYQLHVCPSACGRRFDIAALRNGNKNFVSCLYITEEDAVSGHYEEIIGDAVGELLVALEHTPKAFIIYFSCIDDLLGTDEQALLKRLNEQHPSLRFAICHIDPITLEDKLKPGMRNNDQIYGLLEYTGKKDNGVNLVGSYESFDADSEFFRVLSGWGIDKVRQLYQCKTFADFMQMADSRLNLVMARMGRLAAQNMAEKLDIPYLMTMPSYDMDEVLRQYQAMADILGKRSPDFREEIEQTQQAIQQTRQHIGDMPIIVGASVSSLPSSMAGDLCRYGFNVQAVFFIPWNDDDRQNHEWLANHFPQVAIVRSQDYEPDRGGSFGRECIAIGFDCAYTLQAKHFVDIPHDEIIYGFYGIRKLMRLICEAYDTTADWEDIKERDKELRRL
jgi:nitrogenase molybdenum-iron protein alpha/beta subunit